MNYRNDPTTKKALIVDDDVAMRRSVVRMLERAGIQCRGAASSQEAQAQLAVDAFDIVVTDMRMWGADGLELICHIGENYPTTFTIMMTGFIEPRLHERVEESGGFALFEKPFQQEELLKKVEEAVEQREADVAWLRHVTQWDLAERPLDAMKAALSA